MKKEYLFTAGPTPVPERVNLAMTRPMIYHRSPVFAELFGQVRADLKWLFETEQEVIALAGSGTAGLEAALVNVLSAGDELIFVNGGKFGERFGKIAKAYGLVAHAIDVVWGEAVAVAAVEKALAEHPKARAVCVTASESSTGVVHPVKEIAALCRGREQVICIVDAITAVGCMPMPMDAWGLDVLVTGSQKALMLPPGLALVAASKKAEAMMKSATLPRFYLDLQKERAAHEKNETAWTPAISLIVGLHEALSMLKQEGREATFRRHALLAEACRQAAVAMGCSLLAKNAPASSVTAVNVPEGVDGSALIKRLRQRYGVTMAGGQDHLKGKIFRLAHLGYYFELDILQVLAAVEMALLDLGHRFVPGSGVAAAMQVFRGGSNS